jgi:hypothetical protein
MTAKVYLRANLFLCNQGVRNLKLFVRITNKVKVLTQSTLR